MQFEYDPERLIEEVKKRPGIWDFENVEYRTKNVRHQLWNEVVKELLQTDVKVTKSELRELEIQLQKKWKSIRDCFQKFVQNPNRTRKPYVYCKQLEFLLKNHVQNEGASSESDDPVKNKKRVWKHRKVLKLRKDDEGSSEEDNDNNDHTDHNDESRDYSNDDEIEVPVKVRKTSKPPPNEFVFASVDSQIKTDSDDPDRMFLLSLLPHLKTIPEEMRINVKMDLMQVLRNANYTASRDQKIF